MIATWTQALVVLALVVPGFVYQSTRRRVRGREPEEGDAADRLLRATGTSAVFAGLYLIAFGNWFSLWWRDPDTAVARAQNQVWIVGLLVVLVVFVVPWAAARVIYYVTTSRPWLDAAAWMVTKLRLQRQWDPTPNAWDYAFKARQEQWWVRVQLPDGVWVGGWFGGASYASSWPESRDLFIETAYRMTADGQFTEDITASGGIWVRCDTALTVDFLAGVGENEERVEAETEGGDSDGQEPATR